MTHRNTRPAVPLQLLPADRAKRRKSLAIGMAVLSLVGAGVAAFSPAGSPARELGALLLFLTIPALSYAVFLLIRRRTEPVLPVRRFSPDQPFTAHIEVAVSFLRGAAMPLPADDDTTTLLFAIGSEGFTVRSAPAATHGPDSAVACEFLAPALALPQFCAGTEFSIVHLDRIVGQGRVISRLTETGTAMPAD